MKQLFILVVRQYKLQSRIKQAHIKAALDDVTNVTKLAKLLALHVHYLLDFEQLTSSILLEHVRKRLGTTPVLSVVERLGKQSDSQVRKVYM